MSQSAARQFCRLSLVNLKQRFLVRRHASGVTSLNYARYTGMKKWVTFHTTGCVRSFSDMKNDDMVKSWLKEIREDFEKEAKNMNNSDTVKDDTDPLIVTDNPEALEKLKSIADRIAIPDKESEVECPDQEFSVHDDSEKQGFTAEELVELLKRTSVNVDDGGENSSEYDAASDSDESDSDKEVLENEKSENNKKETGSRETKGILSDAVVTLNYDTKPKTDWSVVEIEDFVNIAQEKESEDHWKPPISLERGKTGVFDVEELVELLQSSNGADIAVVKMPQGIEFADYMVMVSGRSVRHVTAIAADVKRMHKKKKAPQDLFVKTEGDGTDWAALDLGNILLHIFMPKTRELYDLESLWTLGADLDPLCVPEVDPYIFTVDDLPWLEELEQSQPVSKSHDQTDQSQGSDLKADQS